MIATKASRVVHAAKGKSVIEFGLRREHGMTLG
jgi:nicotinic acid phosphoribosyltransferase